MTNIPMPYLINLRLYSSGSWRFDILLLLVAVILSIDILEVGALLLISLLLQLESLMNEEFDTKDSLLVKDGTSR